MNPAVPILQPLDTYDYSPTPPPILNNNLLPSDKALSLQNLTSQSTGSGEKSFRADQSGIWLGASKFIDAPFSVDMLGNVDIKNGQIKIENNNSQTVLDASGLFSTNNFLTGEVSSNSDNTTTSTSPVDLPGSSIPTFELTRPTRFLIFYQALVLNTSFSSNVQGDVEVQVFDSLQGYLSAVAAPGYITYDVADNVYNADYVYTGLTFIFTLNPGTHNLKLQFNARFGGTADCGGFVFGYLQLGS